MDPPLRQAKWYHKLCYYANMAGAPEYKAPEEISEQIRDHLAQKGITQTHVANKLGINQSQVSRIANGRFRRVTSAVQSLCDYAGFDPIKNDVVPNPADSRILMTALKRTWDGTKSHERALAKIIAALADLRP